MLGSKLVGCVKGQRLVTRKISVESKYDCQDYRPGPVLVYIL